MLESKKILFPTGFSPTSDEALASAIRLAHFDNGVVNTLVVDDDRPCRNSIQKVLEREGYTVQVAADVDSALEAISDRRFDLIVCDYRMPAKSGLDLLLQLKRQRCQVPVVMISAFADSLTEAAFVELGAVALLRQELIDRTSRAVRGTTGCQ